MLENGAKEICEENVLCLVDKNTRGKPKTVWIFSVTFLYDKKLNQSSDIRSNTLFRSKEAFNA